LCLKKLADGVRIDKSIDFPDCFFLYQTAKTAASRSNLIELRVSAPHTFERLMNRIAEIVSSRILLRLPNWLYIRKQARGVWDTVTNLTARAMHSTMAAALPIVAAWTAGTPCIDSTENSSLDRPELCLLSLAPLKRSSIVTWTDFSHILTMPAQVPSSDLDSTTILSRHLALLDGSVFLFILLSCS
jgi:hypothetical protein